MEIRLLESREALKIVCGLCGETPAVDFGIRRLSVVREKMIERDWSRGNINKHRPNTTRKPMLLCWIVG